jgi:phosphatidylethanolamine/phosphatidyl-N-methylethanolamine N-methyltransferase
MKSISQDNVIQTYRFYAPLYDSLFGATLEPGRRALSETVHALKPASILEMGVGTGLTLGHYPAAAHVVGVDISHEMLDLARHKVGHLPERDIHLHAMNAETLDFPDDSFDCVTLPYVLSVTPDPGRLVAETRRVCRRDGFIVILNHFSGSPFWWLLERAVRPLADRIGFRSDFNFTEQILVHDWQVESVKAVNLFGLSKLIAIRNV